jgi:hypothetical protein
MKRMQEYDPPPLLGIPEFSLLGQNAATVKFSR